MNFSELQELVAYIVSFDWLKDLFILLIGISTSILNILLFPINLLIGTFLPDISNYLGLVEEMFNYASMYIGWGISALGIDPRVISIALIYLTFRVAITLSTYAFKVFIKWKKAIVV